jgi:uncharacterized membrane protein YeiB
MNEAPGSRAAPDLMPLASGERIVTIDVLRGGSARTPEAS